MKLTNISSKELHYKSTVKWKSGHIGILSAEDKPDYDFACSPDFGGPVGYWTPQDFFVASVNSCVFTTFLDLVDKSRLKIISYQSKADGIATLIEKTYKFTEIIILPEIGVSSEREIKRAKRLIDLAAEFCMIKASLNIPVKVEPEIFLAKKEQ